MVVEVFSREILSQKEVGNAGSIAGYHLLSQYVKEHKKVFLVTENSLDALLVAEYLRKYRQDCFVFGDHELMPYDNFDVSGYIAGQRNSAIYQMLTRSSWVLITSVNAITYKLPPQSFYLNECVKLHVGQKLEIDNFEKILVQSGFNYVSEVSEMAEFSKRGSLFDFYPPAAENPLRIEFFDETIESIRTFSAESQMTLEKVSDVDLVPLSEYLPKDLSLAKTIKNFKLHTGLSKSNFLDSLVNGKYPAGFQFFLPMLYEKLESIFDFLDSNVKVVSFGNIEQQHKALCQKIIERGNLVRGSYGFPTYDIDKIALTQIDNVSFDLALSEDSAHCDLDVDILGKIESKNPFEHLAKMVAQCSDSQWLFAVTSLEKSATFINKIAKIFNQPTISSFKTLEEFAQSSEKVGLFLASFSDAFEFKKLNLVVLSESWVYSYKPAPIQKRKSRHSNGFEVLSDLKVGQLVVHQDHGIGRYQGLKILSLGSFEKEMNELVFADNDKLFVPIEDIHLLSPYFSLEPDMVTLSKLGSSKWTKQKEKAYSVALDQATELLEIYAQRDRVKGTSFKVTDDYYLFCDQFPYQETDDQLKVIAEVIDDMKSVRSMDRLICGDVGFGKTEIAMRAMFVAVQQGTQVAFLAPTTLLAQQHYESLIGRFQHWPITIELMIRSGKKQEILDNIEQGKTDIIVGTHKIIQKSLKYKNLGLIIIDEEHRFGVAQKEQLKKVRSNVDVLSMTATPIPRTLSMSFHGLRDLSIIATPPERRLRVETLIYQESDSLMKEAAERELLRGGQIYYVHNDIATIDAQAQKLRHYFPQIQVGVVHGSMSESEQERVMAKFYHQDLEILVGTTIIETGLDVPNANTIFISNAHHLGLSQLHQLRGRVGRSYHQAYAYLFIPMPIDNLPAHSQYRLRAIFENQDLGAGFQLASTDLELRGAGSLLGDKQSGHVQDIGLETYKKLLRKARESLEGGSDSSQDDSECELELFLSCFIPEKQIPCPYLRLKIYRMWQSAQELSQLELYRNLFIDRFGQMLEETNNKYQVCCIKIKCLKIGITKIKVGREKVSVEMSDTFPYGQRLFELMKKNPKNMKFTGPRSVELKSKLEPKRRLDFCHEFIDYLKDTSGKEVFQIA